MKFYLLNFLIIFISLISIKTDSICTENMLAQEILNDLEDNGKLDCLLPSKDPKKKEKLYTWTSDCAFKSNMNNWKNTLIQNYRLSKELVDVNGNTVRNIEDFENQADMCIIIRSLIANGVFSGISKDVNQISKDVALMFNCPGEKGKTEVCAANAGSFNNRDGWYIFLDGQSMSYQGWPKYSLSK